MTKQLIVYVFCLLTLISYGQKTNLIKSRDSINLQTIELKVKLADTINKVKLPPDCGIFEVNNLTLKYNVIHVIRGDYKANTVLINHRCPRELVEKKIIENDKTYTFRLRPKITLSDTKVDRDKVEYEVIE